LFGLAVRTPSVELRYATDDDLEELAGLRDGAVVAPGEEPFDGESSFYLSGPEAGWKAMTGEWGARARTSAAWWHLSFAVRADGQLVGQQNITAVEFPRVRTVNSFSFLARSHRGRGLGKEMRSAVLHLAFDGLGALRAESDAFADNLASIGVSTALGYEPNGTLLATRPSGAALMRRFLLTRERWEATRRGDIEVVGVEAALPLLGLP
jgi:RimJ/RimL family protein N-acetyltransferase